MKKSERQQLVFTLADRDGARCYYCGKGLQLKTKAKRLPTNYAQVEHKLARAKGGSNELSNLVLSCKGCNRTKGNRDYQEFINTEFQLAKKKFETLIERMREMETINVMS